MKINICNVRMQALHRKLAVVLVQILIRAFARIRPSDAGFTLKPLQPPLLFFHSAAPGLVTFTHLCSRRKGKSLV